MADIFLSYKKEDRARIDVLAKSLEAEGFLVWYDYQIETGEDWFNEILRALRNSACVIGCWTNNSVTPERVFAKSANSAISYILAEHREAGGKLTPAILDPGAIPSEYSQLQAEDLTDWAGDRTDPRWRRLVARIDALIEPAAPGWAKRRIEELKLAVRIEAGKKEQIETQIGALQTRLADEARRAAEAEAGRAAPLRAELAEAKRTIAQLEQELSSTAKGGRPLKSAGDAYFFGNYRGLVLAIGIAAIALNLARGIRFATDTSTSEAQNTFLLTTAYIAFCSLVWVGFRDTEYPANWWTALFLFLIFSLVTGIPTLVALAVVGVCISLFVEVLMLFDANAPTIEAISSLPFYGTVLGHSVMSIIGAIIFVPPARWAIFSLIDALAAKGRRQKAS